MASVMAMVFTAAMAVPGSGPGAVCGEMEQRLDLRGEWEGTLKSAWGDTHPTRLVMKALRSGVTLYLGERTAEDRYFLGTLTDEGGGSQRRAVLAVREGEAPLYIIYEQEGDYLTICWRRWERPCSFRAGNNQDLLILHRVKPRK